MLLRSRAAPRNPNAFVGGRCGVTLTVEFVDELPNVGTTATPELVACFAESLRREPGRWAVYPWSDELAPHSRRSRASDINAGRRGAPAALRDGFQAAVRAGVMYVRFAGGDSA